MTDDAYLAAVRTARAASAAARDEASLRICVDPVAHAVWTLLRNLQDVEELTHDLNERLLDTAAAVLALIDGEGQRGYDRAAAEHRVEAELFDGVRNDRDQLRQHVQDIDRRMAAATARGYDRAVANLHDADGEWLTGVDMEARRVLMDGRVTDLANYLEAQKETHA